MSRSHRPVDGTELDWTQLEQTDDLTFPTPDRPARRRCGSNSLASGVTEPASVRSAIEQVADRLGRH